MNARLIVAAAAVALAAGSLARPAVAQTGVVTIYSADGLHDGTPN
jgi:2-aminoethylphosphonate transport system substrate-binding protein